MRIRWQIATVEVAGFSTWSSLAFSPSGRPSIAYYSSINSALRFATLNDDGTWAISTVDTVHSDCMPSLAFRFGRPAISYRGDTGDLRYAESATGNPPWSINTVVPSALDSSLAFDSSHRPGISYYDPSSRTLNLARQGPSPSVWISQTVDATENVGGFNALAFTPLGAPVERPGDRPAIAYHDPNPTFGAIKYAVFDGTAWHRETVWQGRGWCSLAFDPAGTPFVGFSGHGYRVAVQFKNFPSGWVGAGGASGDTCALAFNHYDPSHPWERAVSYTDGHVRCAVGHAYGLWGVFTVERAGKDQVGNFIGPFELTSVAFSPSGPHLGVTYYDSANATIKYAVGTIVRTPFDTLTDLISVLLGRLLSPWRRISGTGGVTDGQERGVRLRAGNPGQPTPPD